MAQDAIEITTSLTIRLPVSQRREWARRALADGRTLSNWIRWMIGQKIQDRSNPNKEHTP